MPPYEVIYIIREPMSTRQVFGCLPLQQDHPPTATVELPAYRLRRDQVNAADYNDALNKAREIKHSSIDDCYTQSRIVSISTVKNIRIDMEKIIKEFDAV